MTAAVLALGGVVLISAIDFLSGLEIRTFPLYYAPVSLAAWQFGRSGAVAAAVLSAAGWLVSNQFAGLEFSHPAIWAVNTLVQGASFAIVGVLVASLHATLVRERALHRIDPLCQVLSRGAFYEESDRLTGLCRRGRRPVTLAYLDLDDFKAINDRQGHQAGDDVLRKVGAALCSSIRTSDLAARLGGDEFAVLLPELGPAEARQALNRLRDAITESVHASACPVTVTVGAATFMPVPDDLESMVRIADSIMYSAKREGKDRVRLDVVGDEAAMIQAGRSPGLTQHSR